MTVPAAAEHWSAPLIRIGNQAVRAAQERNRRLGIPNWYSLNGRLVSDVQPTEEVAQSTMSGGQVQTPALRQAAQGSS